MKIKLYIVFSVALIMSSCSKWLDIVPSDTVVETELFKEATGYRNALNGVYKQISKPEMYGKEMTWGFVDVMSQYYDGISSYGGYGAASEKYDYANESVKSYLKNMWELTYNSIANCNNLLSRIEGEKPAKFPEGQAEIDLIKGEALALRAFLHFDMLRLFAPSTKNDDGRSYIPYFEKYPSHGEPHTTNKDVKSRIIRDLVQARDLVAKFDTLDRSHIIWMWGQYRFLSKQETSLQSKDIFFAYRGFRMNYSVITAVMARVYNYFGMHEEAKKEAEAIINMTLPDDNDKLFKFTTRSEMENNADVILSEDLIFSLSFPTLHDYFKPFCDGLKPEVLSIADCEDIFDDAGDMRFLTTTSTNGYEYFSLKNMGKSGSYYDMIKDMVPMIRLGEMHYIIAEYYANNGDFTMAAAELDKVRGARGCKKGQLDIYDMDSFVEELINEGRREFLSEGQLFYYYKKYNKMISSRMKPEHFVFPKPDSQNVNF